MSAILEQRQAALPELSPRLAEMKRRIRAGEHHRFRVTDTVDVLAECEREESGLDPAVGPADPAPVRGPDRGDRAGRAHRVHPDGAADSARCTVRSSWSGLLAGRTFHELGPDQQHLRRLGHGPGPGPARAARGGSGRPGPVGRRPGSGDLPGRRGGDHRRRAGTGRPLRRSGPGLRPRRSGRASATGRRPIPPPVSTKRSRPCACAMPFSG